MPLESWTHGPRNPDNAKHLRHGQAALRHTRASDERDFLRENPRYPRWFKALEAVFLLLSQTITAHLGTTKGAWAGQVTILKKAPSATVSGYERCRAA